MPKSVTGKFTNRLAIENSVVDRFQITHVRSQEIFSHIFDLIVEKVKAGEEVNIAGFGKFYFKVTSERNARNPRTGETVTVPPGKKIKFVPAKYFKDQIKL